ncbi:MAG: DNA alkylation repair protein [Deltaproteobacteria bacterium]|nr:DNA alkylation repair protein [Deltaproteobacteria bacterium]
MRNLKRTGFCMMAMMADDMFVVLFKYIKFYATDERNFVKKAVNWALRQIGKRNRYLNEKAVIVAEKMLKIDSKSARWIAKDTLRELKGDQVQVRLKK